MLHVLLCPPHRGEGGDDAVPMWKHSQQGLSYKSKTPSDPPPTPTPTDPRTGLLTFSTFYVFETTARVQHIHAAPFWRGCTVNQTHPTGSQVWKIKPPAGGRTAVGSRGPRSGTRPRQLSDLSSVFIQSKTSFIIRFEMITRHARIRAAWGRKSGETQIP